MPFARPTLGELVERIRSDLRGGLEIAGPLLRRAMVDVLGSVWAGAVHSLYGFLGWNARQMFGTTAERDALLELAGMYGITPTPATYASGNVIATGSNGSDIPADTTVTLGETQYRVVTGQTIADGTATVPVEALIAGSAGNVDEGIALSFESSIPGVDSTVTVDTGGISGGIDEEGTEEVRDRYLQHLRERPTGGSDADYIAWALAVPGVTRAWVYRHENGLGTVVVRFVLDGEENIFPDGSSVSVMQDALDAERPTTAEVTAAAPDPLEVDFDIEITPNTPEVQAAVEAELADLLRREGEPGDGIDRGTIKLSHIRTAIGVAAGVEDYTLNVPSADVVPGVGELTIPGDFTWG